MLYNHNFLKIKEKLEIVNLLGYIFFQGFKESI